VSLQSIYWNPNCLGLQNLPIFKLHVAFLTSMFCAWIVYCMHSFTLIFNFLCYGLLHLYIRYFCEPSNVHGTIRHFIKLLKWAKIKVECRCCCLLPTFMCWSVFKQPKISKIWCNYLMWLLWCASDHLIYMFWRT
jgi:hypothetical protein